MLKKLNRCFHRFFYFKYSEKKCLVPLDYLLINLTFMDLLIGVLLRSAK